MNKAIHFKTSKFDVMKEKENPINPIYGISLLEWLRVELKGSIDITEPDAEDWGWYSELEFDGNNYLIGSCALTDEKEVESQELEWVLQLSKHRSIKDKLFGRNKMQETDSCLLFFKKLIENENEFKEVQLG